MKNKLLISIAALFCSSLLFSQQDAQYTQYMYNTISVNPAYAGSRDAINITGLYRNQWVGVGGAPITQTLSINAPFGKENKIGLGLSIVNDKIGPTQETYFDIDFSYTVNTSETGQLAFGLKGGGHLLNVDFNKLNQFTNSDVLLRTNIDKKFSPNVGVGAYYHTNKFYIGLSAPNLLKTEHFDRSLSNSEGSSFLATERINYYLIAGYVFNINESLKFKPAALVKAVEGSPLQVDISGNLLINDRITAGLAYRWSAAVSAMIGFQISESMLLGFAYDRETTELGNAQFNSGSYEFLLRYEIFKNKRVIHPRFF